MIRKRVTITVDMLDQQSDNSIEKSDSISNSLVEHLNKWEMVNNSDKLNVMVNVRERPNQRVLIVIISYPRKPSPLATTLTACIASDYMITPDMIHIFADCVQQESIYGVDEITRLQQESKYGIDETTRLQHDSIYNINVTTRTQDEMDSFDEFDGCKYLATDNMVRALEWGANNNSDNDIVVELEDDVLFTYSWLAKALDLLQVAEAASNRPVVLSMHNLFMGNAWKENNWPIAVTMYGYKLFEPIQGKFVNGAQGYIMRSSTAKAVSQKLREGLCKFGKCAKERKWFPPDSAMHWACFHAGARYVIVDPTLLLHQTTESTWFFKEDASVFKRFTRNFRPF